MEVRAGAPLAVGAEGAGRAPFPRPAVEAPTANGEAQTGNFSEERNARRAAGRVFLRDFLKVVDLALGYRSVVTRPPEDITATRYGPLKLTTHFEK